MKWCTFLIAFLILFSPLDGRASDSGVVVRPCEVMSEPFKDARAMISLKEGDALDILKRKGGWLKVSAKGKTGWVRMLYIRRGISGERASAGKEASGVLGLATGRAGSGNVVAATGVRGLDEEVLKEAEFNKKEFQKLLKYLTSKKDAQNFAYQAGLKSKAVPFIEPSDGN